MKDRKSSTITLLLKNRKPLRQPNLIQPSSFSPIPPPKTTTIQPLSMQTKLWTQLPSPLLTPFLRPPPVYLELMSTSFFPTNPLCSANVPCSNQLKAVYGHLSPKAPSSSPTLVPIFTNLQLFLFIHGRHPPQLILQSMKAVILSCNCRKHTDTIAVCPHSHQMYLSI